MLLQNTIKNSLLAQILFTHDDTNILYSDSRSKLVSNIAFKCVRFTTMVATIEVHLKQKQKYKLLRTVLRQVVKRKPSNRITKYFSSTGIADDVKYGVGDYGHQ